LIQTQWRASDTGRKRKYYSIKKQGKQALDRQREQWKTVSTVLTRLWKEQYV